MDRLQQTSQRLFANRQNRIIVGLLFVFYLLINLLHIGGDAFVINLNNNIVIPFAMGVFGLSFILWQKMAPGNQNRALWAGLTIGWGLWMVAELWWDIAALIGQEVPYPPWADLLWLAGYIPMYYALWMRIRSLPGMTQTWQRAGIWFSILVTCGWTVFFAIVPIVQTYDPNALLESTLNIIYPLADLVLIIFVLQIFFSYQNGRYSRAWIWLSTGFILHSLSGLFFSYASSANIYYPDGQVNLISTLAVDIPYNLSYVLWVIGLLDFRNSKNDYVFFDTGQIRLTPVPNAHIIISTNVDGTIINISNNYENLFSTRVPQGKTIQDTLGIAEEQARNLFAEIKKGQTLAERAVVVKTSAGDQQASISGIAVSASGQDYSGALLLLRLNSQDNQVDNLISHYHKDLLALILSKTGVKEKEEGEIYQLVSGYYLAYIKALYNRILLEGSAMAEGLLTELQAVGQAHGWQVETNPESAFLEIKSSLAETKKALPALLECAKQFVARAIDEQTAQAVIQNTSAAIDPAIHKNVQCFEPVNI